MFIVIFLANFTISLQGKAENWYFSQTALSSEIFLNLNNFL